jgi:hypothetical protein
MFIGVASKHEKMWGGSVFFCNGEARNDTIVYVIK